MSPGMVTFIGIVIVMVGLLIRFAPLVKRPMWLRVVLTIVIIPFGHAPRSWIPWGMAIALGGVAMAGLGPVSVVATGLALILTLSGAVLLIWSPRWMQPVSTHPGCCPTRADPASSDHLDL